MDTINYLNELEKRGIKVVSIPWVRQQILSERVGGAHSHFQTTEEYLQVREAERSQRAASSLQRDLHIEQQIEEYKLSRIARR